MLNDFQIKYLPLIDERMCSYLADLNTYPTLKQAMLYSVQAGGKRLRPLLLLAVCQSLGRNIDEQVLGIGASLEFIHTYSLIHDDLPEMDNDDLRRGKPTNHKVFGQAMAVLAGDGLLTTAFENLASLDLPAESKVKLMGQLALAAGPQGMVDGQVGDIEGEQKRLTLAELKIVHKKKTGALLHFACLAGAILADADSKQTEALLKFGDCFGLAFQIYDDILDVVSTSKEMGKAVQKDATENKNTFPILLGLDGAYQALTDVLTQAKQELEVLKQMDVDVTLLSEFLGYFKLRK
jgi:geranylgeranyl diphosphate synthase type II